MALTRDNQLSNQAAGTNDWDSGENANHSILERGYHTQANAGLAVATFQILHMTSGGFFVPYNSASADIRPHGFAFTGASSGDSISGLLSGIVRSFGYVPGQNYFASPSGTIVTTPNQWSIGFGVQGGGLYFNPRVYSLSAGVAPFDIHAFLPGLPSSSGYALRLTAVRTFTIPGSLGEKSFANAKALATASVALGIIVNSTAVGSLWFNTNSTTGVFVTAAATLNVVPGDRFSIGLPAQDATLADVAIGIFGTRP